MKQENIDVVVLCGGLGTRLRSAVNDRPKVMAKIGDRPFLDILLDYYYKQGYRRFILCTGYLSDFIKDYYQSEKRDYELIISQEKKSLGTAGALKNAELLINSNLFLIINGDSFCPVDSHKLIAFHKNNKSMLTMVLASSRTNTRASGVVNLEESRKIISFNEKRSSRVGNYLNAGVYLTCKEILSMIPKDDKCSLEYDIFPKMIKKRFYGYIIDREFIDIGTPGSYLRLNKGLRV